MKLADESLAEVLRQGGYITKEDLKSATEEVDFKKQPLREVLLERELVSDDLIGQASAEYYQVKYHDLNTKSPSKETLLQITKQLALNYHTVCFFTDEETIKIATDKPNQPGLIEAVQDIVKDKIVEVYYSLSEDIDDLLINYRDELETRFVDIIKKTQRIAPNIIEEILEDALDLKASDIHFEPQENDVTIRFRIDGILIEKGRIPPEYYENILNRIKIESNLRIDEHYRPQDGSIRAVRRGKTVDMRVSITPTLDGEKIVIRLLSEYISGLSLSDLGIDAEAQKRIMHEATKSYGLILVTGPTGSGKTTTLYSLMRAVNRPEINITTIEDPVEYKIPGINHIQVNKQVDLTFATGLRSIVRQDPDVILVGEIRDKETAEIAVNAALTGHLVLSTFHANDAATAIPRLMDMGIPPYLLSSTLKLVIGQRLVRKIDEKARYSYKAKPSDIKKIFPEAVSFFGKGETTLYKAKEEKYKGRIGVYEMIEITESMGNFILQNPSSFEIWDKAVKEGATSMFEDGIAKVKNGITTLEELNRVVPLPQGVDSITK